MASSNYFPSSLALGKAFCNRKAEIKRLEHNIQSITPALILSPRRYGKTSLAIHTFNRLKMPYAHIDFYKDITEEDIQLSLLKGVGNIISKFETIPNKLIKIAGDFFSNMQVKVVLEKTGIQLDISKNKKRAANMIFEALDNLHQLAVKKNKKAILYMDEFQVLGEITKTHAIEAAIREAAQRSTHIAYVFSGSNRHLIQEMFYDKKRPFYKLCDLIVLNRIAESEYEPFLQKAAEEHWGKKLSNQTINQLFFLTERHPFYINKLCALLWMGKFPDVQMVNDIWDQYVLDHEFLIQREMELLSVNQKKLLIFLSKNTMTKELFSTEFMSRIQMSPSSISRALKMLCDKDYLFLDENKNYVILDPLMKWVLI